jgi:hypothetical protein
MSRSYLFFFAVSTLVAGCTVTSTQPSSSSGMSSGLPSNDGAEYQYLFAAPRSTATPDKMTGIWGREDAEGTYRFELKADQLVIGGRCGEITVGNDDPATFTNDRMETPKTLFTSTTQGGKSCGVTFPKLDAKKCDAQGTAECFTLTGTTLTLKNTGTKDVVLTKISD